MVLGIVTPFTTSIGCLLTRTLRITVRRTVKLIITPLSGVISVAAVVFQGTL